MIAKNIKYLCCEDPSLIENYDEAVADTDRMWVCHHRLELDEDGHRLNTARELKKKGLYTHRPANELIFLTKEDHWKLHMNEEQKQRLRDHQSKLWKDADRVRRAKMLAKERRDNGLNLVNVEQRSSKSAYREYQRLQHRIWYEKNREKWNNYSYNKKLASLTMEEMMQLKDKHEWSRVVADRSGNTERVEKLNRLIALLEMAMTERVLSEGRND